MKKQTKVLAWSLVSFISFTLLHNVIYAFFGAEEPFFFTLALISAAIFVLAMFVGLGQSAWQTISFLRGEDGKQSSRVNKNIINNNEKVITNGNGKSPRGKDSFGNKAADIITSVIGSWRLIIIQSVILGIWMILNIIAWIDHWDPYPFILLNLVLSFQAAYAAPIIMMSQNRTAERDRKKAEIDLATDRKAERGICEIIEKLDKIDKKKIDKILKLLENK